MKQFLLVSCIFCSALAVGAQDKPYPVDSRFTRRFDPCAVPWSNTPSPFKLTKSDSLIRYTDSTGEVLVRLQYEHTQVRKQDLTHNLSFSKYNTDSCWEILLGSGMLRPANLQLIIEQPRIWVNQYGDSTSNINKADGTKWEVFDLLLLDPPPAWKAAPLVIQIGILQPTHPYYRAHYTLSFTLDPKWRKASLYRKLKKAVLRCVYYDGFEI